jgi:hypothetical protein
VSSARPFARVRAPGWLAGVPVLPVPLSYPEKPWSRAWAGAVSAW